MNETHFFINCTEGKGLVLSHFPCAVCDRKVRPDAAFTRVLEKPVQHSLQAGKCPGCRSQHFVISARAKAQCVELEPYMRDMIAKLQSAPQMYGSSFDE